jgi:hypothetical protein
MEEKTQNIRNPQGQKNQQHDFRRHHHNQERARPTDQPVKLEETGLDDEETEEDKSSSHPRPRHGGRPEKKVYEEWASDPYCE